MKYTDDCDNHYERSLSAEMVVIMLMVMMIIPMLRKAVGGPGSPPHYKCHITAMCIVFIKTTINMGMMTMDVLHPHQIRFLPDPGVSGVRSMGPGLCTSLHPAVL